MTLLKVKLHDLGASTWQPLEKVQDGALLLLPAKIQATPLPDLAGGILLVTIKPRISLEFKTKAVKEKGQSE